jgi:hypothetical protein
MTNRLPRVAIIVLCYNGIELTLACLASLRHLTYANAEIVVVDNASHDGTPEKVRAHFPAVTVLETGANLGYAEGNNVGMRYALAHGADYALLLNNDTEVAPDFLSVLINVAETEPQIGVVGPTIYYTAAPQRIWSAGGAINWRKGVSHMVNLNEEDSGQLGAQPRAMDFVTGCALLIKASVIQQVGLLDARFFAYYEETEWCVRVSRAGYKILHVPAAHIWHNLSLAAREASPHVYYYMTRNRLLFLHLTRASWRAWFNTLVLDYARTWLSWRLRPKWQRNRGLQRQLMRQAVWDYWRGRLGRMDIASGQR